MCGRYVSSRSTAELAQAFAIDRIATSQTLDADYNVAPTRQVPVVCERGGSTDRRSERQLRQVRWGLVPSWARSPTGGTRPLINARAETAADKPAFRKALAARRCLLPADGYYEWQADAHGRRQPYFIHSDEAGLARAGLYELWRNPDSDRDDPAAWWWTCAILTTAADESLAWLHHRMPVVVPQPLHDAWLDPARHGAEQLHALTRAPSVGLRAYPVSPEVNNAHNNGAQLLRPWRQVHETGT